jgi:hypothetical protein
LLPVGATPGAPGAISVIQNPPYPYVGSYAVEGEASELTLENEQETELGQAQEAAAKEAADAEQAGRKELGRSRRTAASSSGDKEPAPRSRS